MYQASCLNVVWEILLEIVALSFVKFMFQDGHATIIQDKDTELAEDQKQRISIARAVYQVR